MRPCQAQNMLGTQEKGFFQKAACEPPQLVLSGRHAPCLKNTTFDKHWRSLSRQLYSDFSPLALALFPLSSTRTTLILIWYIGLPYPTISHVSLRFVLQFTAKDPKLPTAPCKSAHIVSAEVNEAKDSNKQIPCKIHKQRFEWEHIGQSFRTFILLSLLRCTLQTLHQSFLNFWVFESLPFHPA